jgi:uncharacterized membrane protein
VELSQKDTVSALVHFYRGELARMTTYRVRLDTTTNWAVGTTAAVTSLSIGSPSVPHFTFGIPFVLVLLFLWMEATRYRVYEMVRLRVRLLEQGFLLEHLEGNPVGGWRERLAASLDKPDPPIDIVQALSVRLRRSYLGLFIIIYLVWLAKIALVSSLPAGARVAFVPGYLVLVLVTLQLIPLVVVALKYPVREEG